MGRLLDRTIAQGRRSIGEARAPAVRLTRAPVPPEVDAPVVASEPRGEDDSEERASDGDGRRGDARRLMEAEPASVPGPAATEAAVAARPRRSLLGDASAGRSPVAETEKGEAARPVGQRGGEGRREARAVAEESRGTPRPAGPRPPVMASLRAPAARKDAAARVLAEAQIEPKAPAVRSRAAVIDEALPRVPVPGGRDENAAARRHSTDTPHADPLRAYLHGAPERMPVAAAATTRREPDPLAALPPPQARADLIIEQMDVRVVAEAAAPVARPVRKAPARSGAWNAATRHYLGRLA